MQAERLDGIIIRTTPSGEADLILTIASASAGKISIMAKHARKSVKRFGGSVDLFDQGTFDTKRGRGSLALLDGFVPRTPFKNLRADLNKLTLAATLCESFDFLVLVDQGTDEESFDLLRLGLEAVDSASDLKQALRGTFLALSSLLSNAGFLDTPATPLPSLKNLVALLSHLERCVEKPLKSKSSLMLLLEAMRKKDKTSANKN